MVTESKRFIPKKKDVWEAFIKRGILTLVTYDTETFGLPRQDVPHPIQGSPILTEYAHVVTDIGGNYVDNFQIFPKRPETEMGDPEAPLVLRKTPKDFDSNDRTPYSESVAEILWELETRPFRYEEIAEKFGDKVKIIKFSLYNSTFDLDRSTDKEESIIDIPLEDDEGNIVYDVRYHPDRQKISFK